MSGTSSREEKLKYLVQLLPEKPGIYQFLNSEEKTIYVGKAKNLKKRVASYFTKTHENGKTRVLVKKTFDIKHVVVKSEQDALLLENSLIKKWQPRYNVLLKDDKTFPWICIKNEPFPRIFSTRNVIKDGSEYFGPYTSARTVKIILNLVRQIYKLRTCNYNLSQENIVAGKFKVCLEYHIGNCNAPCIGKVEREKYDNAISEIRKIIKGNIHSVISYMKNLMQTYAEEFKFEDAHDIKEKLVLLENFQSKSEIVSTAISNVDIFSLIDDKEYAYVNFLRILNGSIIQAHTIELKKKLDESKEELLSYAIIELRNRLNSTSNEIVTPFVADIQLDNVKFTIPKQGDKKQLLELSIRNAKYFKIEQEKKRAQLKGQTREIRILTKLKDDLRMKEIPYRIECFDNSNFQGSFPVASCVVFINAKPAKKQYRHFNIKTVEGINDFASMREIVHRRYKRMLDESTQLPQLVVVDGGKGQLSAAYEALQELDIVGKVAIIGIAKRLEEIYFPNDPVPLYIDKNSESLKLIQQTRNEAHRFAITFHRTKRSKSVVKSKLEDIPGIGTKTIEKLLIEFKTISNIQRIDPEYIVKLIGKDKAEKIEKFFMTDNLNN
ncbi:MAG: excinuclease ABC subunit UvrC [Bacteroidales bacterium]|nr:excinuclease ABC subunit UvrC [Bacteroidales bacterium]MCF8457681.1 excinuclease ABC subunit UvrC [Bacteroidales bacterium]